ncbi:hypothetical protein DFH28DRAFT_1222596 [Melampsora americana]|nr:hypothetical protein DFH28DRAFT_1222596 [Melampsora americana]
MFFLKALIVSVLIATISTASIPEANIAAQETLQGRSTDMPPQKIERRATPGSRCYRNRQGIYECHDP